MPKLRNLLSITYVYFVVVSLCALSLFIVFFDLVASFQPDLSIYRIVFSHPANPGDDLLIESEIRKEKGGPAENSLAQARIDINNDGTWDVESDVKFVPRLIEDISGVTLNWKGIWTITAGTHRFEVCVDTENKIAESNETNNCAYTVQTFKPPSGELPDLMIGVSGYSPVDTPGAFSTFDALVENEGGSAVPPVDVRLRIDMGNNGGWDIVPPLVFTDPIGHKSGQFVYWSKLWQPTSVKTFRLEFCADTEGKIKESNEKNNCSSWVVEPKLEYDDLPLHKSTSGYLDITFIGDNYTNANEFSADVEKFKNYLLKFEPFKSRSSQILFHWVDSAKDLDCQMQKSPKVPGCDVITAIKETIDAGVPYDKLIIVAKGLSGGIVGITSGIEGRKGSDIAVLGNQKETFVHEFAHTFGLVHEHVEFPAEGTTTDHCEANCCMSDKCVDWQGIEGAACIKGCTHPNWYRSSQASFMTGSLGGQWAEYFNVVSQRIISEQMDEYIDATPPTVSMLEPEDGAVVSGEVQHDIRVTGGARVQKMELYVDDDLFVTNYNPPRLVGAWDTRKLEPDSQHTLYAKAYDGEGNVAETEHVVVKIDSNPKAYPDLAVTEVNFSPQNPIVGSVMNFWAAIKDKGRRDSSVQTITRLFLRDTAAYDTWIINPADRSTRYLSKGEEVLESWDNLWTAKAGSYKVEVCADMDYAIGQQDADQDNNCITKTFTVSEAGTSIPIEKPVVLSRNEKFSLPLLNDQLPSAGLTSSNPLYFIDMFFESIRRLFSGSAEKKAELEMSFIAERLAEIRLMIDGIGPKAEELRATEKNLETSMTRVKLILERERTKGKDLTSLTERLANDFSKYQKTYADFFERKRIKLEEKEDGIKGSLDWLKDPEQPKQKENKEYAKKLNKDLTDVRAKKKAWQEAELKITAILSNFERVLSVPFSKPLREE